MKRIVLLLTVMILGLTLLGGAVAVARTLSCNGGLCVGTDRNDTMFGSAVRDRMYGRKGSDLMRGSGGNDYMNGDGARDRMAGGNGNDTIAGGANDDSLVGNRGRDVINGGPGNDRVDGVDGMKDRLDCGPGGNDVVLYDRGLDIVNFSSCETRIPR